jgi:hypothetical protein
VRPRRTRGGLLPALALIVLILAALFLGRAGELQLPPLVSYSIAAAAALLLAWRMWRRRRRR